MSEKQQMPFSSGLKMGQETLPFMGDTSFWKLVSRLSSSDEPALSVDGHRATPEQVKPTSKIEILPSGERLLRGEGDWLGTNPPERWVGGVRINPRRISIGDLMQVVEPSAGINPVPGSVFPNWAVSGSSKRTLQGNGVKRLRRSDPESSKFTLRRKAIALS